MSKFKGACGELWVVVLYWAIRDRCTHPAPSLAGFPNYSLIAL